jgi:hypothetical protein
MQVNTIKNNKFDPIVITIETQIEADLIFYALLSTSLEIFKTKNKSGDKLYKKLKSRFNKYGIDNATITQCKMFKTYTDICERSKKCKK